MTQTLHELSFDENENKQEIYNMWSNDYDTYVKELGYEGPKNMTDLLKDHIEKNKVILDFGCGTGLLGEHVKKKLKPQNLLGVDISIGMIQKCKKKKIYDKLYCVDITENNIFKIENIDYIVSCGVFLEGHVSFEVIPKVMNMLKEGGSFFFTVRLSFYQTHKDLLNKIIKNYKTLFISNLKYIPNVECLIFGIKKI